ncbi:hypothetical protein L21SP3_00232 [Sedimentisphaera cyanobacteriorum]|uniref:PA14 domain protein n=1 Tax=Sedimentisphaera cyanobacteriorum TaxID=1940790 RepID=A0A1Q2HMF8_9BACT|nr:hypothetical protein [Sedimentisphaera cyanobacteriorum]AQQ08455.1 hypothetical protein L21SP3_00232 [Sedimentisphaera cyanobacteriorum]
MKICLIIGAACFFASFPCLAEDPDYGGDISTAEVIVPGSGEIYGTLTPSGDNDWFKFSSPGVTLYRISLDSTANGYKYMEIYFVDALGTSERQTSDAIHSGSLTKDVFIEPAEDVCIRIWGSEGNYSVQAAALGTYPEDSYSDDCSSPTMIALDTLIEGTITHFDPILQLPADEDWFEFEAEQMHRYQILLGDADNRNMNFWLYYEDCEPVNLSGTSRTIVSLNGENYKIKVAGGQYEKGEYYNLQVTDLGVMQDDYPNFSDQAVEITPGADLTEGSIEYNQDLNPDFDWFKFTPQAETLYRITIVSRNNGGYKYIQVFQENDYGELISYFLTATWNKAETFDVFIEKDAPVYYKIYGSGYLGDYSVGAKILEAFPEDSYSNDCSTASEIIVGEPAIDGTINRSDPANSIPIDTDWFKFETQRLHKYEIVLTASDYSNVNFKLYDNDCSLLQNINYNYATMVSLYDGFYKINVLGNDSKIGEYYNLSVIDLGLQEEDHGNTFENATLFSQLDGTRQSGEINYSANINTDFDFLKFIAPMTGTYTLGLENLSAAGYVYLQFFVEETAGLYNYMRGSSDYKGGNSAEDSLNLIEGKYYYMKVYGDLGPYETYIVSPEPRCGDLNHPHPVGDANEDCVVDMLDIAEMAGSWLTDNRPAE